LTYYGIANNFSWRGTLTPKAESRGRVLGEGAASQGYPPARGVGGLLNASPVGFRWNPD